MQILWHVVADTGCGDSGKGVGLEIQGEVHNVWKGEEEEL